MNSKKILGFSLATVFAVSMIFMGNAMASNGIPGHLDIKDWSVKTHDGVLKAKIVTEKRIPKFGASFAGAFGYGMVFATHDGTATGLPENVLVDASHICASDSFQQKNALPFRCKDGIIGISGLVPSDQWHKNEAANHHPHNLDLKGQTSECEAALDAAGKDEGAAALEVDFDRTLGAGTYPGNGEANPSISGDWKTHVFWNKLRIGNVPISEIGDGSNTTPALVVAFEIVPISNDSGEITNLCLATITPAQSFR